MCRCRNTHQSPADLIQKSVELTTREPVEGFERGSLADPLPGTESAVTGESDTTALFTEATAGDTPTAEGAAADESQSKETAKESQAKVVTAKRVALNKVSTGEISREGTIPEAGLSPDSMGTPTASCCHDRPSYFLEYGKSYFSKSYLANSSFPESCAKCTKDLTGRSGTYVCPEVGKRGSTCRHALCKVCHAEASLSEVDGNSRSTRGRRNWAGKSGHVIERRKPA